MVLSRSVCIGCMMLSIVCRILLIITTLAGLSEPHMVFAFPNLCDPCSYSHIQVLT